jgi:membrane-associated progesterone receptor component
MAGASTQVGELTVDELLKYDGSDSSRPIYVAIRKRIFDVSSAKVFYGPGGSYAVFAGKDASRALAKMSTKAEDAIGSLEGLTEKELKVLDDWEKKFENKYPVVGSLA